LNYLSDITVQYNRIRETHLADGNKEKLLPESSVAEYQMSSVLDVLCKLPAIFRNLLVLFSRSRNNGRQL
jgi:hypothetical protein